MYGRHRKATYNKTREHNRSQHKTIQDNTRRMLFLLSPFHSLSPLTLTHYPLLTLILNVPYLKLLHHITLPKLHHCPFTLSNLTLTKPYLSSCLVPRLSFRPSNFLTPTQTLILSLLTLTLTLALTFLNLIQTLILSLLPLTPSP